jgi:hypothetical protein
LERGVLGHGHVWCARDTMVDGRGLLGVALPVLHGEGRGMGHSVYPLCVGEGLERLHVRQGARNTHLNVAAKGDWCDAVLRHLAC